MQPQPTYAQVTGPVARVRVIKEVTHGALAVSDALFDPRAACIPVTRLLGAQVTWGPSQTDTFLIRRGIWPTRIVHDLTDLERMLLADDLRVMEEAA